MSSQPNSHPPSNPPFRIDTSPRIQRLPPYLFGRINKMKYDKRVANIDIIDLYFDQGDGTRYRSLGCAPCTFGIKSTASVVTSAAIVMVGVFSIFGTLSVLFLKQFGVGLAIAVLLDATIVRAILLPATMKLLGDWNWYLPKWLEWLPRLEHGESIETVEAIPALGPVG